jgi:ABC-type dipeptide/oligopeptide/nickel transport system permease component
MMAMSLCTFSNNFQIFDVTPVENLFILEFMLKAPGDFVKVYLYGLKQCYHPNASENTLEAFSHALGLEKTLIQNAFHYWSRQGILSYSEDQEHGLQIQYYNIKDVLYNHSLNTEKDLYKYKDLQSKPGNDRPGL